MINRTFRGVSAHFEDVFEELVLNGEGELIVRSTTIDEPNKTDKEMDGRNGSQDDEGNDNEKTGFDPKNPDVSLYRLITITVTIQFFIDSILQRQEVQKL